MHALRTNPEANLGVSLGVACIASLSGVRGAYKGDTRACMHAPFTSKVLGGLGH